MTFSKCFYTALTCIKGDNKFDVSITSDYLPCHTICMNFQKVLIDFFTGKVAQPFSGVYSSTKFALDGFFGSLRQEFALRNCDVSVTLCVIGLVGEYM